MAQRNEKEAGAFGVTPQSFKSATADKQNREVSSQIAELQKKVAAVETAAPGEDETPADTELFALRFAGYAWPYVTGAVSITSGSPDLDVPGSGFGPGNLYKGEKLDFEFHLDQVTASGLAYFKFDVLGNAGQGSPEAVVATAQPYTPGTVSNRTVFAGAFFAFDRRIYNARLRVRLGSAGGSISVPNLATMLQRFAVYSPVRRPS